MGLWSISSDGKPSFLSDEQKEKTEATNTGWELTHDNSDKEVIVAINDLATKIENNGGKVTITVSAQTDTHRNKLVSDLQTSDTAISTDNVVSGTLKYVSGFTDFSPDETLQSGHYFAYDVSVIPTDATVVVTNVGGDNDGGTATLSYPDDMWMITRVSDTSQAIKIEATLTNGNVVTETITLTGLTLETAQ